MQQRQCRTCKEYFLLNDRCFYKRHDGRFYDECKQCYKEKSRIRRAEDKEKERTERLKTMILEPTIEFEEDKIYKLKIKLQRNQQRVFKGKLIQETSRFITLKGHHYTESFLKSDLGLDIEFI